MNNKFRVYIIAIIIFLPFSVLQSQTWNELNKYFNKYLYDKDYKKAIEYAKKEIIKSQKDYGVNSRFYAISLFDLSLSYTYVGRFEESEEIAIKASNILKSVSGYESADYAESLRVLANIYIDIEKYQEVNRLFEESLKIFEIVLGTNHPKYLSVLNDLARIYIASGDYLKAEKLYSDKSKILLIKYNNNGTLYISYLINLDNLYKYTGRLDKSEIICKEFINLIDSLYGVKSKDYAFALNKYADLLLLKKEYEKSESLYKKVLTFTKNNDKDYDSYASALYDLGRLYFDWGKYNEAEKICVEVSQIYLKYLGKDNLSYGICLGLLGAIVGLEGRFDEAEKYLLESLPIYINKLGYNHPNMDNILLSLGTLYSIKNNFEQAKYYFDLSNKNMFNQVNNVFPALSENEKLDFINKFDKHFTLFNSFCFDNYFSNPNIIGEQINFSIINKNLILNSEFNINNYLKTSIDSVLLNLHNKLSTYRGILSKKITLKITDQKSSNINVDEIEAKIKEIEKEISLKYGSVKNFV